MIASLEGNIAVVRALLKRGGEIDNFDLSLMPKCQFYTREFLQYSIAKFHSNTWIHCSNPGMSFRKARSRQGANQTWSFDRTVQL